MLITQYWNTSPPPAEVASLICSVRQLNPGCHHMLFDENSAGEFIAAHFTAREVSAFRACAVPAMQADYLRYCALLSTGGVYIDADMLCCESIQPIFQSPDQARFYVRPGREVVPNGFFFVRSPGHPMLRCALDVATANIERRSFKKAWFATGPGIFSILYWMSLAEPPDRLQERLTQSHDPENIAAMKLLADEVASYVGNKLEEIVKGVTFSPMPTHGGPVRSVPLSYKATQIHWTKWPGSLYR
jgi:mannosyltransferase OCH1-like enzyme